MTSHDDQGEVDLDYNEAPLTPDQVAQIAASMVEFGFTNPILVDETDGILAAIDRGQHAGGAAGRFWTLDPIDGTKGFLRGGQYAIALALLEGGHVPASPNEVIREVLDWLDQYLGPVWDGD